MTTNAGINSPTLSSLIPRDELVNTKWRKDPVCITESTGRRVYLLPVRCPQLLLLLLSALSAGLVRQCEILRAAGGLTAPVDQPVASGRADFLSYLIFSYRENSELHAIRICISPPRSR